MWGVNGLFIGNKRGCVAESAGLWTPSMNVTCPDGNSEFEAIDSSQWPEGSGLSINYNIGGYESVDDYFIAPATPGEFNIHPGDMNGDLQMSQVDSMIINQCIGQPTSNMGCQKTDLDGDEITTCADWDLFVPLWVQYVNEPTDVPEECAVVETTGACCWLDGNGCWITEESECSAFICNLYELLPETFTGCFSDADADGFVTPADRGLISANFDTTNMYHICKFDMDGDGNVTPSDRGFISANFDQCNSLPDYQNGSGLNHGSLDTRFGGGSFMGVGTSCSDAVCP